MRHHSGQSGAWVPRNRACTCPIRTSQCPPAKVSGGAAPKVSFALGTVPGLSLDLSCTASLEPVLAGEQLPDAGELRALKLAVEGVPGLSVLLSGPPGPVMNLAEVAVRSVLDRIEVEEREGSLLDELSANWESLEALYEISTDILRFGDLTAALRRLIDRFVSLQDGLHAVLMLGRKGKLEAIVASDPGEAHFEWSDLGRVEAPIRKAGQSCSVSLRHGEMSLRARHGWARQHWQQLLSPRGS